jgi:drug/metabolite transporter (DMT)-like permease
LDYLIFHVPICFQINLFKILDCFFDIINVNNYRLKGKGEFMKNINNVSKYRKNNILSIIALALVAMAWGTSYAITKDAINSVQPFTLMTLRFTFSAIILSIFFCKRLKGIRKKDIYHSSIIGIFMFLAFLTLVIGITYTTASKQSFLIGTYVLIVPFLAWIVHKRKPDIYSILGALLATVGISLLTLNGSLYLNKGDLISLLCSIFFACHMVSIEYFNKEWDPIASTIIQFIVTSILFIICTGIFESFNFILTERIIRSIAYLVIVTTVIAFAVQNIAQKHISSTNTALILTLESIFGSLFAIIFYNEVLTTQMVIGCMVIFLGILTQATKWKFFKNK